MTHQPFPASQGSRRAAPTRLSAALIAATLVCSAATTVLPGTATAAGTGPVLHYSLIGQGGDHVDDVTTGNRDATLVGGTRLTPEGVVLDGIDDFVDLPDNLMAGMRAITVGLDVKIAAASAAQNYFVWGLGNTTGGAGDGYLFTTGNPYRAGIAAGNWTTETNTATTGKAGDLPRDRWVHLTYTQTGTIGVLYRDGVEVARNTAVTTAPGSIGGGVTTANFIGKSVYTADPLLKATVRDFQLYDRALDAAEVAALSAASNPTEAAATGFDSTKIAIPNLDDVRGNITMPTTGEYGTTTRWTSSQPNVITPTGEVSRPATGQPATTVTLTATTIKGAASTTRTFTATVKPAPAPLDYEGYFFPFFKGESNTTQEEIYFALSQGNDPTRWQQLNNDKSVLQSTLGEEGLRDPFIIRSAEGDRFYMLATDLNMSDLYTSFGRAQETGSRSLMIWESTDLVNWGSQREVRVSSNYAGNTWAPEATWDAARGEYVVYWASNLYDTMDPNARQVTSSYNQMMYATTRDFVTFSEPKPWVDARRGPGQGMIDADIVKDGDTYYRFIKDEASYDVRQEKSTDVQATVSGSLPTSTSTPGWQLIKEHIGQGQPNPWGGTYTQGEGPSGFRDNENPNRWYLLIDQPAYHGGQGYILFQNDDLASGIWTSRPDAELPLSPRHGTILPVTQSEYDRLLTAYQPGAVLASTAPVAVSTEPGLAPALPTTVAASYADGSVKPVSVTWATVNPASYATAGTSFTVSGKVSGSSTIAATVTVTVADRTAPVLTVTVAPATPNGLEGWWTTPVDLNASATDDSGPAPAVQLSRDGGTTWDAFTAQRITDGAATWNVRAVDSTGNISAVVEKSVRVDGVAPTTNSVVDAAARTVTVAGADREPGSGMKRLEYRISGGAWTPVDGARAVVTVGAAAATVEYRAVDVAGNVGTTGSASLPASGGTAGTATVTLTSADQPTDDGWYTADVLATITAPVGTAAQYRLDGGTWRTYTRGVTVSTNGAHVLEHRLVRNNAVVANSVTTMPVKLDKTVPTATVVRVPGTGAGTPRNPVTLSFGASDTLSGVDQIEYMVNQSSWTPIDAGRTLTFATVGSYLVSYRSYDIAGNASALRNLTVTITANVATTVKASVTTVARGGFVTFTLAGFDRFDTVALTAAGLALGSGFTDQNGNAKVTIQLPAATPMGSATVTARGSDGDPSATVQLNVR